MPEFETILRQRLGAMEDPKHHPDPDTLTAFVEELLPVAERNGVYQHLSLCKQCRDVVALTLPERSFAAAAADEEKEQIVTPLPVPRRWWFLTPQFGLVASLVAVAAGLFLVLEIPRMHQNGGSSQTALVVQKQDGPPSAAAPSSVPSPSLQANDGVANFVEPQPQSNLRASAAPPSFAGEQDRRIAPSAIFPERKDSIVTRHQPVVPAAASRSRDYVNNQVLANQVFAADLVAPAPAQNLPSAPSPVLRDFVFMQPGSLSQSGKATFGTTFLAGSGASISSQGTTTVYPLTGPDRPVKTSFLARVTGSGRLHLKRQIPSISPETAGSYAMFSPGLAKSETAEIAAKTAEPSAAGTDLGHSAAFTGGGLRGKPSALDLGANAFLWRVVQGKLLKSSDMEHWTDGYPVTEGIDFSMVTASGAEVWAGGKDAALVHSKDGGLTWERITLGASAAGNITGIEVNHSTIRVTSSSGQGWLSKDGGRSWTLQD